MVKAIAEQRGWQHRSHAQLFGAVATIASETGDEVIDRLFELARITAAAATYSGTELRGLRPRLPWTSAAAPSLRQAAKTRRSWRSLIPRSSAACALGS